MINAGQAPGSRIYLAGNIIGFDGPLSAGFFAGAARMSARPSPNASTRSGSRAPGAGCCG